MNESDIMALLHTNPWDSDKKDNMGQEGTYSMFRPLLTPYMLYQLKPAA
jgi:hypothetical protein